MADAWVHPNPIPSFPLVDQEGEPFRLGELRDAYVLVGLIFTHCSMPKACPLTTQKMHEVGKLWRRAEQNGETAGKTLRLLTLTFDPEADTPEVLKAYSELVRRDVPNWIFATGPTELMEERLPQMFGVIAGEKTPEGDIAHSVKVALLGPGLRPRHTWTDNAFDPEEIVEQVLR
jgi:protein SCO1/2